MPTMRKDLHVGLAIGGVLLAVLIVWGVVVNHGKQHKQAVTLETTAPGGTGSEIPPAPSTPTPGTEGSGQTIAPDPNVTPPAAPPTDTGNATTPAVPATPVATQTKDNNANWTALLAGNATIPPATDTGSATPAAPAAPGGPTIVVDATPKNDQATDAKTQNNGSTVVTGGQTSGGPDNKSITTTPPAAPSDSGTSIHVDAAAAPRTHKVAKGETFASISRAVYGDSRYYDQIAQANPKINPNRLRPGTIINLPDAAEVKASSKREAKADASTASAPSSPKPASSSAGIDTQKQYRVVAGDSLYKISMRLYGSGEEVDHLYALNKDTIGPDEAKLKLGMVLKIPAPPTVATASR
jgi:nucleoid-associated protein YgaU